MVWVHQVRPFDSLNSRIELVRIEDKIRVFSFKDLAFTLNADTPNALSSFVNLPILISVSRHDVANAQQQQHGRI